MNKKTQILVTICVDISMLAVLVAASYLLFTGRVSGGWQIAAQAAVIVAIPTMFFVSFLTFGTGRYEKPEFEDDPEWDDPESPESGETERDETAPRTQMENKNP